MDLSPCPQAISAGLQGHRSQSNSHSGGKRQPSARVVNDNKGCAFPCHESQGPWSSRDTKKDPHFLAGPIFNENSEKRLRRLWRSNSLGQSAEKSHFSLKAERYKDGHGLSGI